MKQKPIKLRMDAATYYMWVGGSCDYAHEERAGGGAYIMEKLDPDFTFPTSTGHIVVVSIERARQ